MSELRRYIGHDDKGKINSIIYYNSKGERHREDGPAVTLYINGLIYTQIYLKHNTFHRLDGPAIVEWGMSGRIIEEWYYRHDQLHRNNGPAVIWYNIDGSIRSKMYYLKDKLITDELKIMLIEGGAI